MDQKELLYNRDVVINKQEFLKIIENKIDDLIRLYEQTSFAPRMWIDTFNNELNIEGYHSYLQVGLERIVNHNNKYDSSTRSRDMLYENLKVIKTKIGIEVQNLEQEQIRLTNKIKELENEQTN